MHISGFNIRLFVVMFVMALSLEMSGQSNPDIKTLLSKSDNSKYQKADKLIAKGYSFAGSVGSVNSDVALSKQAGRESNMKKEQAYLLMKDGYNIKLRVLSRYFEDFIGKSDLSETNGSKVAAIHTAINEAMAKSKKLYAKSNKTSRLSKSIQMQEEAQQIQSAAIIAAEEGLMLVQNFEPAKVEKSIAVSKDTLVKEIVVSEPVVEPVTVEPEVVAVASLPVAAVVKEEVEEKEKAVEQVVVNKPDDFSVYFTIQVLADKKPATVAQQKMVYNGARKVIENVGSGWYRYSVGRFLSYSEAASTMKSEAIKGYVVAYKGSERITTQEAKRILGGVK